MTWKILHLFFKTCPKIGMTFKFDLFFLCRRISGLDFQHRDEKKADCLLKEVTTKILVFQSFRICIEYIWGTIFKNNCYEIWICLKNIWGHLFKKILILSFMENKQFSKCEFKRLLEYIALFWQFVTLWWRVHAVSRARPLERTNS